MRRMAKVEGPWRTPRKAVEELIQACTTIDPETGDEILDPDFPRRLKKLNARLFQAEREGTGKKQEEHRAIGDLNPITRVDEPVRRGGKSHRKDAPTIGYCVKHSHGLQHEFIESVRRADAAAENRMAAIDAQREKPPRYPKVVIDTNVLLGGITGDPDADRVLELARERKVQAVAIPAILDEYGAALARPAVREGSLTPKRKQRARQVVGQVRDISRGRAVTIDPDAVPDDPSDNIFVAAARLAGPTVTIISVDWHFERATGVTVMTPGEFLAQLAPQTLLGLEGENNS